jgi:putative spermidine/putrescine transport system ATP-binding protein
MTEVSALSLVKRYGDQTAIADVSLKVERGAFVSLLGPSGCGKTTTLKCLAGFEEIDDGRILFDGRDVTRLPPEQRDIGMVFQNYALFPHMTAAGNIAFGLEMRKTPRAEIARRVASALDLVQLKGLGDRYPRSLSGGQQQRVALARALVIEPKILLLDEPLANLDAKLRDEMRGFIRALQRRVGITAIYVTHDQVEAMTMSDKVAVMFAGRIAQAADPETIYDRPADRAVATFVGQANILSCAVDESGALRCVGGRPPKPAGFCAAPGSTVEIMARPESIEVVPANDPGAHLIGKIVECSFLGAVVDYRVAVADARLAAHIAPPARFREGEQVGLRLNPARLWPLRSAA